jgi:hypothetical protein
LKHSGMTIWIRILEALMALTVLYAIIYVYILTRTQVLQISFSVVLIGLLGWYAYRSGGFLARKPVLEPPISTLILLDEEGESLKEWSLGGKTSLLIGKSSSYSEVDIDLSDAEYAALISKQHAILNYASGGWFIEDIDSRTGVGVQKNNQSSKQKSKIEKPQQIKRGDIIYIANTRLLVK